MAATEATKAADEAYDVIVLGAGPAGENVADRAHAAGLSAVIVESELVGGECSYWACMPSKALLRPVIARADARRVPGLKRQPRTCPWTRPRSSPTATSSPPTGRTTARSAGWTRHRRRPRTAATAGSPGRARVVVDGPDGDGTCSPPGTPSPSAPAAAPSLPDLPGLAEARPWTSREATSAKAVPGRLVVVGGGVVGVEMATAWQALGSQVTLLVRGDGLLPRMEPFAGELVAEALTEAGRDVRGPASSVARYAGKPARRPGHRRRWTPATASRPTRSSSPPAAPRAPTTSAWRRSA